MTKPFLSIIIPAYNEAERLPLTLIDLDRQLNQEEFSYEILVVNDGSDDLTSKIVDRFLPAIEHLKLIENSGHRGKGSALRIGMLSGKGDWRLYMDADNSIPISEFKNILPLTRESGDCDILVASRRAKGTQFSEMPPWSHRIRDYLNNIFIRVVFKSKIRDFFLGFHCFKGDAAEKLFALAKTDSWAFSPEILLLGEGLGYKVKEIPVMASHNETGQRFKFRDQLKIMAEIVKIRWWIKRGKYNAV